MPSFSKLSFVPGFLLVALSIMHCGAAMATAAEEPSGQQRAQAAGQGLVGTTAPRMVLKTIDGDTIDLGSLYGKKAVYLKFWATWCTPCREQMPHFERTYESAGPDLAVIAINAGFNDSLEEIQRYRRELRITMPIVLDDGTLGAAFKLRVTPQHIVIGRDGRIAYVGHLADSKLDAALLQARNAPAGADAHGIELKSDASQYVVGQRVPQLDAIMLDGQTFHLRQSGSKQPTVLVFLSPWCESYLATTRPQLSANCRSVREQSDALAKASHARWIGIASGIWATRGELASYRDTNKVAISLTLDDSGAWFRTFRVVTVPTVIVADADGTIRGRLEGAAAAAPQALAGSIR